MSHDFGCTFVIGYLQLMKCSFDGVVKLGGMLVIHFRMFQSFFGPLFLNDIFDVVDAEVNAP